MATNTIPATISAGRLAKSKKYLTGKWRIVFKKRWFRKPLVVVQVEWIVFGQVGTSNCDITYYGPATTEDIRSLNTRAFTLKEPEPFPYYATE